MIAENDDKSNISGHFKYKNGITKGPIQISNISCNVFINVGTNHASATPQPKESVF